MAGRLRALGVQDWLAVDGRAGEGREVLENPAPLPVAWTRDQTPCKMQTVFMGRGGTHGSDSKEPIKGSYDYSEVGTGQGAAKRLQSLPQSEVRSLQKPTGKTPLAGEHIQARARLHKGQSPETPTLRRSPSLARAEGRREE